MGGDEGSAAGALAGRQTDRAGEVTYRLDRLVDPAAVAAVYRSVGWEHMARDADRLGQALRASTEVATAWDGDEAVGVARLLADGVFHGLILGVAVRPGYQRRGIGTRLVQMLADLNPGMHYHLWTHSRRFSFYGRLGFRRDDTAMERPAPKPGAPAESPAAEGGR